MNQSHLSPRAPRMRQAAMAVAAFAVAFGVVGSHDPSPEPTAPVVSAPTTTTSTTIAAALSATSPAATEQAIADPFITSVGVEPAVDTATAAPGSAAQAEAIFTQLVPEPWRAAAPAAFVVIGGYTSMSYTNGVIAITDFHLTGDPAHAAAVIAHEWAHQAAYRFGSHAFLGAPPAGFPYTGSLPEEMWADCVSYTLTGVSDPSHGLAPCPAGSLAFASSWLAAGPPPLAMRLRITGPH